MARTKRDLKRTTGELGPEDPKTIYVENTKETTKITLITNSKNYITPMFSKLTNSKNYITSRTLVDTTKIK